MARLNSSHSFPRDYVPKQVFGAIFFLSTMVFRNILAECRILIADDNNNNNNNNNNLTSE